MKQATLYKYYDKDKRLLYVGVTTNLVQRHTSHQSTAKWRKLIDDMQITDFDTLDAALLAEEDAIKHEKPLYNKRRGSRSDNVKATISLTPDAWEAIHELLQKRRISGLGSTTMSSVICDAVCFFRSKTND